MEALRKLEAETLLLRASEEILKYGLSTVLTKSPTGAVNCYGAIYLACGASHKQMPMDCFDPVDAGVPDKFQPLAEELSLYMEAFCKTDDLVQFVQANDLDVGSVARLFNRAAVRLIIMGESNKPS